MNFSIDQIYSLVDTYAWPFFRIGGLLMFLPVVGTRMIPIKVRLLLAFFLTGIIAPLTPTFMSGDIAIFQTALMIAEQILIGIAMGFVLQLAFQTFILAGQIIAMQSGLGFAALVDPGTGASVPLVGQFYLMLVSLVFLAINGHLISIQILADSFTILPIAFNSFSAANIGELLNFSGWMFKGAILVALPAVISLLIINIAFAVMTRAAPQLNIFAIGFPITLTISLFIIYITLSSLFPHIETSFHKGFETMRVLLR